MFWMAAGLLMQSYSNSQNNSANKVAAWKQEANALDESAAAWINNVGDNKAVAEANLANTIRTGYKVGMLNVQKAQARKAALQQTINLGKSRQEALGAATANAAAAGTVGASVDAVTLDIEQRIGDMQISGEAAQEVMEMNFDTQLYDILNSGMDALQSPQKISVRKVGHYEGASRGEVYGSVAASAIGQYAQSRMSLGLGNKTAPAPYAEKSYGVTD